VIKYASQPVSKCQLVKPKNVFVGQAISPKDATYKQVLEKSLQTLSTQNIESSLPFNLRWCVWPRSGKLRQLTCLRI